MAVNVSKVSEPIACATTFLPKTQAVLSYRWSVCDAKTLLNKFASVTSPKFAVVVDNKTSLWQLLIQKYNSQFSMFLYSEAEDTSSPRLKVVLQDCTFTFVNLEKKEVVYTKILPSVDCNIGSGQVEYGRVCLGIREVDQYFCDGRLTIQVDAILCSCSDTVMHIEEKPVLQDKLMPLVSLFDNDLFTDLTIKCGGEEFKAHKAVLACQSPVFRRMLESDMKEQRTNIIEISDVDPEVMSDLLAYLYTAW